MQSGKCVSVLNLKLLVRHKFVSELPNRKVGFKPPRRMPLLVLSIMPSQVCDSSYYVEFRSKASGKLDM